MTHFFIPGHPRPQGSKRHVGNGVLVESSGHHAAWRAKCVQVLKLHHRGETHTGAVGVMVSFVMPRPKRPKYNHPYQGDLDKLQRTLGDALELAGVIANDAHIVCWQPIKRFARPGEQPGAYVRLETNQKVLDEWIDACDSYTMPPIPRPA